MFFPFVFSFKVVFQTLLGLSYSVIWLSISFGRGRPGVNFHKTLHNQPISTGLHIIGIALSFHMSVPPQSASSHHIPNCLYTQASSQFSDGLTFFWANFTCILINLIHIPHYTFLRNVYSYSLFTYTKVGILVLQLLLKSIFHHVLILFLGYKNNLLDSNPFLQNKKYHSAGHMTSVWAVDNFFADGAMTNPEMVYETFDAEPDSTFWIFWPGGKIAKFCSFNTRYS